MLKVLITMSKNIDELLKKPIEYLKGVGEARAKLFHKLNIYNVFDVISYYPREYEDRSSIKSIGELKDGDSCSFEGTISSEVVEYKVRKGLTIYSATIYDGLNAIKGVWFNQHYIKNIFKIGERYVFYGKIARKYGKFEINSPVYEKIEDTKTKNMCRIVPIYPSTFKLTQNSIRKIIAASLELTTGSFEEIIPRWIREKYKLSEINYSINNIHFPESEKDFENARYRLVFEELLLFQLGLFSIKSTVQDDKEGIKFNPAKKVDLLIKELPFKLTNAQQKVWQEINKNMESKSVMNRLVQGDVGSGKTVIAMLALLKAIENGYQGVLMVPTEILAEQHYQSIKRMFEKLEINVTLLVGSVTKKQKNLIKDEIKEGKIHVVIGTHALLEDDVEFKKLGIVITDEQHRFGVRQRAALNRKGENPDVLVMTATPIPRTLALILYGDLDISIIDELPPNRKPIETYAVDNSMRDRINKFIGKKVSEGRQVYIVCPLVEESEAIEANSATEIAERIATKDFKNYNVGLIHGKMKAKDKDDIMKKFSMGTIDILVSTTVIEVGVNVPNASVMIIENSERFGLAQLHQLRGRVGRGEYQSYCILYNESESKISKERMNIMTKTNDGFVISEKDLEIRGPGDFFGTRQHGIPQLKIANLYRDIEVLKTVQDIAVKILEEDKLMDSEENIRMKNKMVEIFGSKIKELSFN